MRCEGDVGRVRALMAVYVLRGDAQFDERRNTSRVFPVPPGAVEEALRACAHLRQSDPALVKWIEAGAPAIHSDAEHLEWFGEPYVGRTRRRPS